MTNLLIIDFIIPQSVYFEKTFLKKYVSQNIF